MKERATKRGLKEKRVDISMAIRCYASATAGCDGRR